MTQTCSSWSQMAATSETVKMSRATRFVGTAGLISSGPAGPLDTTARYTRVATPMFADREPARPAVAAAQEVPKEKERPVAGVTVSGDVPSGVGGRGYFPRPWTSMAPSQCRPSKNTDLPRDTGPEIRKRPRPQAARPSPPLNQPRCQPQLWPAQDKIQIAERAAPPQSLPLPAVSSLGGFRTPAAVPVETFATAGVFTEAEVVSLSVWPGAISDFSLAEGPALRDHVLNASEKPRPTDRELNSGADPADHCRQEISRTAIAPAVQHFRMQPGYHRRGPQVDRRSCSSG